MAERDLAQVTRNYPTDHDEQQSEVLSCYMKQSVRPSWEEMATALWNIGENRTAQKIADKYGMGILKHALAMYMNMISVPCTFIG